MAFFIITSHKLIRIWKKKEKKKKTSKNIKIVKQTVMNFITIMRTLEVFIALKIPIYP